MATDNGCKKTRLKKKKKKTNLHTVVIRLILLISVELVAVRSVGCFCRRNLNLFVKCKLDCEEYSEGRSYESLEHISESLPVVTVSQLPW